MILCDDDADSECLTKVSRRLDKAEHDLWIISLVGPLLMLFCVHGACNSQAVV